MIAPKFTQREWDAVLSALAFVDAGEDPWEHTASEDDVSPTLKAARSALKKLQRMKAMT